MPWQVPPGLDIVSTLPGDGNPATWNFGSSTGRNLAEESLEQSD